MASITFKAKVRNAITMMPGEVAYQFVEVPVLTRAHCDMAAFRKHPKFGGLANSDLFPNVLLRVRRDVTQTGGWIRLDRLPANVTVDTTGFLAVCKIEV